MNLVERLLAIIAPHACIVCGAENELLCGRCALLLSVVPSRCYGCGRVTKEYRTCPACRRASPLYAVVPFTFYKEPAVRELVHLLKYQRAQAAAPVMASVMVERNPPRAGMVLCPLPTANTRVRQRGYDQAVLMAHEISRLTGLPCASLLRRRGEQRQVGQGRAARKAQLREVFMSARLVPPNTHVLLVDDVLTTGASCEAAAATLLGAGAKRVSAIVFAVA